MWRVFDKESATSVVEVEEAEEVVALSIPAAQAFQDHLHEDETRHAVDHLRDGTLIPTFRFEGLIEEGLRGAGLVHGQYHVKHHALFRDRDLHCHTAEELQLAAGQDRVLTQGHPSSSGRDCQAAPFHL